MGQFRRFTRCAETGGAISRGIILLISAMVSILPHGVSARTHPEGFPAVLSIRERTQFVHRITEKRLGELLPGFMRQTGLDMWIITCNEDNYDPVFLTMVPYKHWCPITQILVFYDRGPDRDVERLNISRSTLEGLYDDAWDHKAWDADETESQWDCLRRIVHQRDPKRIGINEGQVQWAAGGLTVVLKNRLVEAIGPTYAARLASAEPLATLWCETLLDEEFEMMEQTAAISHAIIAETFSSKVITTGHTTIDDLRYHYWQRVADLGLDLAFYPFFKIRCRHPSQIAKYGQDDTVIRPGDILHCDVGIKYMNYNCDTQELAYVLRLGETDVPEGFKKLMAQCNRLQDIYCSQFKAGLTGNELLANILAKAKAEGIPTPKVYSHSLGLFLHEPGPLIGLPWEQVANPGRGDVKLVPNSCFVVELSVTGPIPEWGVDWRLPLEQDIAFTPEGTRYLDGRQTTFHLVR